MPQDVVLEVKSHIAYITAAVRGRALKDVCEEINGTEDIYVAVLSGDCFAAAGGEEEEGLAAAVAAIERPVIASISGEAVGPGLEIALSADIRLASDSARFALPQVGQGRIPADGGTQRLPRIVGRGKALELLLTAESVSAQQALEIGLVSKIVPAAELQKEAQKLAKTIAAKGPLALRYLKEAIVKGMDMTLEQGLRLEADLYFLLHTTSDRTEGIKSFLEKRPPNYQGK